MADGLGTAIIAGAAALGGALLTALATIVQARFSSGPAKMTAEAAMDAAINARVTLLLEQYSSDNLSLRGEVRGLKSLISHLILHMDQLTRALEQNGIPVPPMDSSYVGRQDWPFDVILGGKLGGS